MGGVPHTDAVEVISLEPDKNPVPDCLANVASPFPITISDMAGGLTWPGRSKCSIFIYLGLVIDGLNTYLSQLIKDPDPVTYRLWPQEDPHEMERN